MFVGSAHAAVLICAQTWHCYGLRDSKCQVFKNTENVVLVTVALACCMLFAIFVCVMFVDQIYYIVKGTGTIDSKQKEERKNELAEFLNETELTGLERLK